VLANKADIVIRIGGKNFDAEGMGKNLQATSIFSQRKVILVTSETSSIKGKQTGSFRPGSKGCMTEADFHFRMA
jgi:hypothetical protein